MTGPATGPATGPVQRLLRPQTVAVLGASSTPGKAGYRALAHILSHGPGGAHVYPVHPAHESVQGVRAYRSVTDIGERIDVAVLALPAAAVPAAMAECAAAGVRTAIVLSSGFAEVGGQGADLERELVQAAAAGGIRLVGPNCAGLINCLTDTALFFGTILSDWSEPFKPGRMALVSQSGAMGTMLLGLARREGIALSHVITTGNEVDLQWADFVTALADEPGVDVILGYLENIRGPERFTRALDHARQRGRQVVLLKAGRTEAGIRSAQAHTAALVGSDEALTAVLDHYGVILAEDLRDLVDTGLALVATGSRPVRRVALVTGSGGMGVLMADQASRNGIEVPVLGAQTQRELRAVLPPFGSPANPIDGTGQMGRSPQMVHDIVLAAQRSPDVDLVLCLLGGLPRTTMATAEAIASAFAKRDEQHDKPVAACCIEPAGAAISLLNRAGIPCFVDPAQAMRALGHLRRGIDTSVGDTSAGASGRAAADEGATRPSPLPIATILDELRSRGAEVAASRMAASPAEVAEVADTMTAPYMLKAHLPGVAHKSERGAVIGPVFPGDRERSADFAARFAAQDAVFEFQEYVQGSWELLVAATRDPDFGYIVTVGLGGLLVEVLGRVVTFLPPLARHDLARRLAASSLAAVVRGVRGQPAIDLDELLRICQAVLGLAADHDLVLLECNPVIVERGTGRLVIADVHAEETDRPTKPATG